MLDLEELDKRFTYHKPKDGQPEKYKFLRGQAKELADNINQECPDSREKSVALARLDEVVFWANAAIARNE